MSLPTLITRGNVVPQKWMNTAEKRKLENQVSIDFILDFLIDRMPNKRKQYSKFRAKNLGDKVILLKSGTGSGKSTNLPPQLFYTFFKKLFKNIAVTEPRRLTTESIPEDILEFQPELKMGDNIGWQTKAVSRKPVSGIIFMTIGILVQQFKTYTDEEIMNKYMFILIDEFHERTLEIDTLLFYIKRFLGRNYDNPDCPIIILMSATFEKISYIEYFDIPDKNYIEVKGISFPKKHIFETNPVNNWIERVLELVKHIHMSEEGFLDVGLLADKMGLSSDESSKTKNKHSTLCDTTTGCDSRDIIIFVQGKAQIDEIIKKLHMLNLDDDFIKGGYISPIGIDSYIYNKGGREYQSLLSPIKGIITKLMMKKHDNNQSKTIDWEKKEVAVTRRVIVSTNVAETGITIPSLKYCIETGFVISVEFDPIFGSKLILNKNVSQGASEQRAGRVGRKGPGIVYYLYTEKMRNMFLKDMHPDIILKEFTNNLLSSIIEETGAELDDTHQNDPEGICMHDDLYQKLIYTKSFDSLALDYLSYPSADSIQYSLEKLYILGFITQKGSSLAPYKTQKNGEIYPTMMGYISNNIRYMRTENKRMILASYQYGANTIDLITIATFIEIGWIKISTKRRKSSKPMNPMGLKNKEEILMYNKIFFGDEFIEYLWIWLLFMEYIDKLDQKGILKISSLIDWCDDRNLNYEGLINIIIERDEIVENLLTQNIDIFYNGLGLKRGTYNLLDIIRKDMDAGMEEIKKIKHCIFEGFKLNIATYNNTMREYILDYKNVPLKIIQSPLINPFPLDSDEIKQSVPKKIIVSEINVVRNYYNPGMYAFAAGDCISVLDGFVICDDGLITEFP